MSDELVERVAEAIYNERNKGLKNCWAWQDSGLDEEHPGTRDAIICLARAALAIIEPAVREECAKVTDAKAVSLDAFAVGFAIMPSAAAPYAIRATDARDLAAAIRAGAMTELRACPFCGGVVQLHAHAASVRCKNKDCRVKPHVTAAKDDAAIAAWNRRADDWQPIETAPKDGTPVVLIGIYPDGKTWSDQLQCWWQWTARPSRVVTHDGQWVRWHYSMETVPPTHWRPLPEGPR